MCGIAGYILNKPIQPSSEGLESLLQSIRKRGPDDEGICLIESAQNTHRFYRNDNTYQALASLPHIKASDGYVHDIALLQTRYAILDLSQKGHQPFISQDGSIIAIFNGEIYNYLELRKELEASGVSFCTQCDTEVLTEGYAQWKDELWGKMNGFWAVVLYDRHTHTLVLSRDRIGVAPLYYRETPEGLFFSSYIASLLDSNGRKANFNEDSIRGFLETGLKDIEYSTYYEGIKTLPAASVVHLSGPKRLVSDAKRHDFWSLPDTRLGERDLSFESAVKNFREIFFNAVDIRLRADVKLAFELSGGLDSSSVVAAAACLAKQKITTYTAKIKDANEEPYAHSILKKYDVDYRVIDKIEDQFIHDYISFTRLMEEPYDNPNAYTHHQMLRLMKEEGVKVVVTGAGGDEVLAGYEASFWPKAYEQWRQEGPLGFFRADWYEFCRRFKTPRSAFKTLKHYMMDPGRRISGFKKKGPKVLQSPGGGKALEYQNQYDSLTFDQQRRFHFNVALLPFYMRSSDHFTMGIPIEHRFPLLDYRIIEFCLRLPISYLFRNGWTKYILRKAMEPYLPSKIVWRRQKMGFQFPYSRYFKMHRNTFEPVLKAGYPDCDYQQMLTTDPIKLWRYLSTVIWRQNNEDL
ncbi:MAG: asparagine synthase (glutamine-hydrolyzing) [Candidatus Omnitrophica bacterium]|nr:asparagine synthase (glutamine-hydrolyzing) [Candidatus Omnitrophota bacterium]